MDNIKVIILAAGKGTRMSESDNPMPKVLREAHGKPLLSYAIDSTSLLSLKPEDITIVVGYMKEMIIDCFNDQGYQFAIQDDGGYGTGYAVKCAVAQSNLDNFDGLVLVLQGDVPLIKPETIKKLVAHNIENRCACTLLSCISQRQIPFGRIVRDENGEFEAIVEDKNCTPQQKLIRELNVGNYVFDARKLVCALDEIKVNSLSNELYLTDVPGIMRQNKEKVDAMPTTDETELLGVNTFEDLKIIEEILDSRKQLS